jgi:hypothetical protein
MRDETRRARLSENLLTCGSPSDLPVEDVRRRLTDTSYVCIRGLADPAEVARARLAWQARFDPDADRPVDPSRPERIRRNFQCVFSRPVGGGKPGRPQLLRAFYNPLWDDDLFGMHALFRIIGRVRNLLMNLPEEFALQGPERGLWTASRIHQYPRGGGFMVPHRDNSFSSLSGEYGFSAYYQFTLIMSRKGVDYTEGGAYFEDQGVRVFSEEEYEIGDLLVYDDRIVHGVEAIDPHVPLDMRSPTGRLAAFANLYRVV